MQAESPPFQLEGLFTHISVYMGTTRLKNLFTLVRFYPFLPFRWRKRWTAFEYIIMLSHVFVFAVAIWLSPIYRTATGIYVQNSWKVTKIRTAKFSTTTLQYPDLAVFQKVFNPSPRDKTHNVRHNLEIILLSVGFYSSTRFEWIGKNDLQSACWRIRFT